MLKLKKNHTIHLKCNESQNYLAHHAEEQLQELKRTRPEQIDQMIGIYEKASSPDEPD